jgi:TolC family type I secretion outer membrane protein
MGVVLSRRLFRGVATLAVVGLAAVPAAAQTLPEALTSLVQQHKKLQAAQSDVTAAKENVDVAWGNWYPNLDVTAHKGYEVDKLGEGGKDTHLPAERFDVTVTQRLVDFGRNNSVIDRADLGRQQSEATLTATRQALLQEGTTAYLEVMRAARVLRFAESSETNIRRQTELEDARVQRGSGFSTDVLQAKTQFAGAQARRVRAEGTLQTALNHYRSVFYADVLNPDSMAQPRTPLDMVPTSLNDAIDVAHDNNPQLRAAQLGAEMARTDITRTRAQGFYPTLDAVAENDYQKDNGGTIGTENDQIVKLQLKYSFNLGFTASNSLKAAEATHSATEQRYYDTRNTVEQQVRDAWNELQTAQSTAELLRNQANIAAEFLELARKERQLGRRSLIDVLSGETALINANSDAASAETDVAIAVYKLLTATGKLEVGVVQ